VNPPTLRIGLVVHQFVYPDTTGSLFACGGLGVLDLVASTFVDVGRSGVAQRFMEHEHEKYLLFVDGDMVFKREDVLRLTDDMERHPDIGCLSAICTFRDGSYKPVAHWIEDGAYVSGDELMQRTVKYMGKGTVADVSLQGTGFMMIRKEAIEGMEPPIFKSGYDENGNFWGEDIKFVEGVREAGWRTCIDFGVQVGHIGACVYYPDVITQIQEAKHAI
jgi:hypothetical protein